MSSHGVNGSQRRNGLAQSQGFMGAAARFWQRSYASDYVGLAILLTCYILLVLFIEPFHRMFYLQNLAIQFPHAEIERVSVLWLFIYALFLPLTILLAWTIVPTPFQPSRHKAHVTILGFSSAFLLTLFLTDVLKNAIGRPRPDLIARCKPAPGTPGDVLVGFEVCTEGNHHVLHDGWRSFPSGHSSFSFAGLGYTSCWLAGQLRIFRPSHRGLGLGAVLVCIAPLLGAALIAISRCEDYRHDVYDVTVGSVLGLGVAYGMYRRYYPALRSRSCDSPYPNPMERGDGFAKVRDEEERVGSSARRESAYGEFELESLDGGEGDLGDLGNGGVGAGERWPLNRTRS